MSSETGQPKNSFHCLGRVSLHSMSQKYERCLICGFSFFPFLNTSFVGCLSVSCHQCVLSVLWWLNIFFSSTNYLFNSSQSIGSEGPIWTWLERLERISEIFFNEWDICISLCWEFFKLCESQERVFVADEKSWDRRHPLFFFLFISTISLQKKHFLHFM